MAPDFHYPICLYGVHRNNFIFIWQELQVWFEVLTVVSRPSLIGHDVQLRRLVLTFRRNIYEGCWFLRNAGIWVPKYPINLVHLLPWSRTIATTPPYPRCKLSKYLQLFKYIINITHLHVMYKVCLITNFTADFPAISCKAHTRPSAQLVYILQLHALYCSSKLAGQPSNRQTITQSIAVHTIWHSFVRYWPDESRASVFQ